MRITALDHLVLTVGDLDATVAFDEPIASIERELAEAGIAIEVGPVERTGAQGPLESVYVRDPDGNLVELSHPL